MYVLLPVLYAVAKATWLHFTRVTNGIEICLCGTCLMILCVETLRVIRVGGGGYTFSHRVMLMKGHITCVRCIFNMYCFM